MRVITMTTYKDLALELFETLDWDEVDSNSLISILTECDELYANDGNSYLTDSQYDFVYNFTEAQAPDNEYFTGIGSDVRGEKIKLPFTMGSLDQVQKGFIEEWIAKWNLQDEDIVISDKLDGTSTMTIFKNTGGFQIGYSRGNGIEGADISRHMRKVRGFQQTIDNNGNVITIRGENIFEFTSFKYLKANFKRKDGKPYKNPRNMMAGVMNASEKEDEIYEYVKFVAYQIVGSELSKEDQFKKLEELGFETPYRIVYKGKDLTDDMLVKMIELRKQDSIYEIDGIVLDVVSAEKRAEMNPTRDTLNPAYTIKYKITGDIFEIPVINVEYNPSSHGYWKPRVNLQPTEIGGVTVSWATGFNAAFIRDNKIGPGAVLKVTRSGDVIPFIMGVVTAAEAPQMPTDEYPWHWSKNQDGKEVDAVLDNPNDLPVVAIKRMVKFFDKIDAPLLKMGNVEKLQDAGLDIAGIIKAPEEVLVKILGKNGSKIYRGLHNKLEDIPLYKIVGAYSTQRGIGVRMMKKIQDAWGREEMYSCRSVDAIATVNGFNTISAIAAINALEDFKDFYAGVCPYVFIAEDAEIGTGMANQKVCMSGFRDKEMAAKIEAEGGTIQSSVSGKTTLLVTKDPNSTTGKPEKARKLGIEIISIEEMQERLK